MAPGPARRPIASSRVNLRSLRISRSSSASAAERGLSCLSLMGLGPQMEDAAYRNRRSRPRRARCGRMPHLRARHTAAVEAFHNEIAARRQTQIAVGFVGTGVLFFDVKAQADDAGVGFGFTAQLVEERPEDPLSAMLRMNVHALQPPDVAIAPVAPLVGVHQLPDGAPRVGGDQVTSLAGVGQQSPHAWLDMRAVEYFPLTLFGQEAIEFDDCRPVVRDSGTDSNGHVWFPWFLTSRTNIPRIETAGDRDIVGPLDDCPAVRKYRKLRLFAGKRQAHQKSVLRNFP